MIPAGLDGETHINVYSKGATVLGRWLSNFEHAPFSVPEHGQFASIEAYWYWLGCEDDALRGLHGYAAKREGKKRERTIARPDFEWLVLQAIDAKLRAYPEFMRALGESTLPLAHYYVAGDRRIDAGYEWIIRHLEGRRVVIRDWMARQGL